MNKRFYYLPVYLGIATFVLTIPLVVFKLTSKTETQQVVTRATQSFTSVSLFPQKASYKLGNEIPVGVIYESNSEKIKKLDIILTFDPQKAQIISVSKGILMDSYPTLRFDNKLGQVMIFGENTTEKAVNGILASLKFKAKAAGIVNIDFASQTGAQKTTGAEFIISP